MRWGFTLPRAEGLRQYKSCRDRIECYNRFVPWPITDVLHLIATSSTTSLNQSCHGRWTRRSSLSTGRAIFSELNSDLSPTHFSQLLLTSPSPKLACISTNTDKSTNWALNVCKDYSTHRQQVSTYHTPAPMGFQTYWPRFHDPGCSCWLLCMYLG